MTRLLFLLLLLLPAALAKGSDKDPAMTYQYRIYLRDKLSSPYSLKKPRAFLSEKSLERRRRQGLTVDSTDLPVTPYYIEQIRNAGLKVMGTSRWHNTVWVESTTDDVADRVKDLPFVKRVLRTRAAILPNPKATLQSVPSDTLTSDSLTGEPYGKGQWQIANIGGTGLHDAGFRGKGMTIAILDAGFRNADRIPAMTGIDIVATRDFAPRRTNDIFREHYHGTMVLSTMAMDTTGVMVGTAPEASYALIRTEDNDTETPAEEDSWTMGVEFADSLGADLINSSLGYHHWDGDSIGPELRQLDGRTWFISKTASMLARKGIILCNSAGNEGIGPWHKISVPADADGILTVGAVCQDSTIAMFSSLGPSQDGRVKPDVCAPGSMVWVVNGQGRLAKNNGTSFASPIMCGMVACLWQAFPQKTATEIMQMVRDCADRHLWPDSVYGYGIPNFRKNLPHLQ